MGELLLASCAEKVVLHALSGDAKQCKKISEFEGAKKRTNCVVFNHTGNAVLSAGEDGAIVVTRINGERVWALPQPLDQAGRISSLSVSPGTRYTATGCDDGFVRLWDMKLRKVSRTFHGTSQSPITRVEFNSEGHTLAAATETGEVHIFSIVTNKTVASLKNPPEENHHSTQAAAAVRGLHFSPLRKDILATCSDSGSIYVWDTTTRSLKAACPRVHASSASDICFSPINRALLASAGLDKKMLLVDTGRSKVIYTLSCQEPLTAISFDPTGRKIAVGTTLGSIFVFNISSGEVALTQNILVHQPGPVNCVRFYISANEEKRSSSSKSSKSPTPVPRSAQNDHSVSKEKFSSRTSEVSSTGRNGTSDISLTRKIGDEKANVKQQTPAKTETSLGASKHGMSLFSPAPTQINQTKVEKSLEIPSIGNVEMPNNQSSDSVHANLRLGEEQLLSVALASASKQRASPKNIDDVVLSTSRSPQDPTPFSFPSKLATDRSPLSSESTISPGRSPSPSKSAETSDSPLLGRVVQGSRSEDPGTLSVSSHRQNQLDGNGVQRLARLEDMVSGMRDEIRTDMNNLQLEVMRQFRIQLSDIKESLNQFSSKFADLIDENNRLRAENERLRNLF